MSKKTFGPRFSPQTFCINIYKLYECDKNQMPCYNVKSFEKWIFWEFWAIDLTYHILSPYYISQIKFMHKNACI